MSVPVPLRLDQVERWLGAAVVGEVRRTPLPGGRTSAVVERITIPYSGSAVEVVAKRATPGEVAGLQSLDVVDPVFPELIDSGVDDDGPWVVTPFHHGEQIGWSTEPPPAVYAALARLHLRHLGRTDELSPQIPRVDDDFVRYALTDFAPSRLARAAEQAPHPVHARALELLERFAEDNRLRAGLAALPATLLHGDVYGDNVIVGPDTPQLIDWGSARVGPAMLDVMMAGGPAGIASYEQTWALLTGEPLDEWELATGQAWAVAVSNAMFVGVIAERSGDFAAEVLDQAETAIERLGRQLSLR